VDVWAAKSPGALLYALPLAAGCGLFLDGLIAISRRWWPLTYGAACVIAARLALPYTLDRGAHFSFEGRFVEWIHGSFYATIAIGFPLLYAVARGLGVRVRERLLLIVIAAGAVFANQRILPTGYYASHAFISWAAAVLVGAAISLRTPRKWLAAVAAIAAIAFAIPPANHTRIALFRPSTTIAPWVAATLWKLPEGDPSPAWSAKPPQPSQPSGPLVDKPIVILFVVDGLRLDQLGGLPAAQRLKQRGVDFREVHSPGAQTATTMASVFSGKYYSQLAWRRFGEGHLYHSYPVDDPSPRVPALLSAAGVRTVKLGGIGFLANRYGIAPGFSEERLVPRDDRLGPGNELVAQVLPHLQATSPTFVYVHFTDTHTPYRGPAGCAVWDCYHAAVETVDSYLGQVLDAIGESPRVLLLFTADHGEAFGEHDSGGHSTTIYDILLKVPLIAYGAGLAPRVVNEPVSLIDLAPTLLELFGQPTPAGFVGESLVGKFRGEGPRLTRPIFAEGRLRRAVVDGDLKVIVDLRRKTVEAYDLARDPAELDNLYDREPQRFAAALGKLTSFYAANTAPGGPTYRP
jgi:hypothetical protein